MSDKVPSVEPVVGHEIGDGTGPVLVYVVDRALGQQAEPEAPETGRDKRYSNWKTN